MAKIGIHGWMQSVLNTSNVPCDWQGGTGG